MYKSRWSTVFSYCSIRQLQQFSWLLAIGQLSSYQSENQTCTKFLVESELTLYGQYVPHLCLARFCPNLVHINMIFRYLARKGFTFCKKKWVKNLVGCSTRYSLNWAQRNIYIKLRADISRTKNIHNYIDIRWGYMSPDNSTYSFSAFYTQKFH